MTAHYGIAAARRSLLHFLVGRGTSSVLGLLWLLLVVRLLEPVEYGTYVALLATVELFYLVTGLGLSTVAQRYLAEYRIHAPQTQFSRFVVGLLVRRFALAALAVVPLLLFLRPLSDWIGAPLAPAALWAVGAWLVLGSMTRFLDEVLPALLLQGVSQSMAVLSNVLRLAVAAWAWQAGHQLNHVSLAWIESAAAGVVTLASVALLALYLRRHPGTDGPEPHHNPGMWPAAWRLYVVQLVGQAWNGNAARLAVTRLAGAAAAAPFGFCLALVDMLRRYLPAYLLVTWVRPLMVARYVQHRDLASVTVMASVVLKLSTLGLVPVLAFFLVHGEGLLNLLSGGRYGAGVGVVLVLLTVWLLLQCVHVVVATVSIVLEQAALNLRATWLACSALLLLPLATLWPAMIVVSLILCVAEFLWVCVVLRALRPLMGEHELRLWPVSSMAIGVLPAAVVLWLLPVLSGWALLLGLPVAAIVCVFWAFLIGAFPMSERVLMARLLPARWQRYLRV